MISESFRDRVFTISDPDARLRKPDALDEMLAGAGGTPQRIPNGTKIKIDAVKVVPAGADAVVIYVRAVGENGAPIGWTSANNLAGKFLSETVGRIDPAPGAGRFGPNAAWEKGAYLGQVVLVQVVGAQRVLKQIAEATADDFLAMVAAAREAGVSLGINSGFRTYAKQKELYDGFKARRPGYNPANPPGASNHQNGIAFDIDVGGGGSNATYVWLTKNATRFGFLRTVSREVWHWEYLPAKAAAARARGVFGTFM